MEHQTTDLTPEQQEAQAVVEREDYRTMLISCIPTLKCEVLAAEYMLAEIEGAPGVQGRKDEFIQAAKAITGVLPPFTDCALRLIAGKAQG